MATVCKERIRTKRRTITLVEQDCCGVAKTTGGSVINVLDGGTIAAADDNIAIEAIGGRSGTIENIGTGKRYEMSYPIRISKGTPSAPPEIDLPLKGSAHVSATVSVFDVNDVSGTLNAGDLLTNTTQVNDVGIIATVDNQVYLKGSLTVNGAFLTGVSTISVANTSVGQLNSGDTFTIAGDATVYTVSATTDWVNCAGSNQDVSFTPTLAQDTVGAEAITVTGRYRVFMYTTTNAPVATDALTVTATGATCVIQATVNDSALVYYPVYKNSELTFLTVLDNWDNKERIAYDVLGNVAIEANGGDFPRLTYTAQGIYNQVTDNALVEANVCSVGVKPFKDARIIVDGRDMRDLPITAFTLDAGVDIQPENDVQSANYVDGFILNNQMPTGTLNVLQSTVADFDWDTYRDNETIFELTVIHNQNGATGERIRFSIPAAQLNAYAAPGDRNGNQEANATFAANIPCGLANSLPTYFIHIF
jgi:hypothetical protein